jgi:diguanylate cyclase (GGDEF)-like protein/hemerythrin-like metal-binding protein
VGSFVWNQQYETGLHDVDEQHHGLVDIINEFGDLLTKNVFKPDDFAVAIEKLQAYAQNHFQDEEALMHERHIDHRHIEKQQREHKGFLSTVNAMSKRAHLDTEGGPKMLFDFLIHWLAYHILVLDKNMARQLALIETGLTPAEAYTVEKKQNNKATEPLLVALKGLIEQISKRNQALEELNNSLEQKIAERTKALLEANLMLEDLAMTDALTNLPNRRQAMSVLRKLWDEALQNNTPLACMMIDADGFKQINDTYGHDAGDIVLCALAQKLRDSVRSDDIVVRLGGDEFLIICPETHLDGALNIADIVRQRVKALQVPAGNGIWYGSISVGVAVSSTALSSPDELIKLADEGVYVAKHDGKNCVRTCCR